MLLTLFVGLFTSRIVLNSLGVEDYGIYNVVGGFVSMFQILSSGLSSATQRFITFDLGKGDMKELNRTFSSCVIIYMIIASVVFLVAEIAGIWFLDHKMVIPEERMTAAYWTFQLSLLTLLIGLISTPYNALLISHERMKTFAYISIYEVLAKLAVAYQISRTNYDRLIVYAIMLCIIQLSIRFIYSSYCRRNFVESKLKYQFDYAKIKQIYGFTGWAMFGGLAYMGFTQGLNLLLNMFFGPVVNAARGVAVQVQHVINNFVTNFQVAVNPQIIKSYARNDKEYMYKLIFASSKYSFLLIFFLSLPVLIETNQILTLWLKQVPDYSSVFFRLIIITTIIDGISNPFMRSVDATGNIKKYQLVVGGILLMIVPVAYIVLKLGGAPYSVFVVHIILGFIALCFRLYLAGNLVGIPIRKYLKEVVLRLTFVTIFSIIAPISVYMNMDESYLRLLIVCVTSVFSISAFAWFFALQANERKIVYTKINVVLDRFRKK